MEMEFDGSALYRTFAGFTDGTGDTQPIETQYYKAASNFEVGDGTDGRGQDAAFEPETDLHELDIVGNVENDDDDIDISSIPDESPAAQFKMPKTPRMAGSKRDSGGNIISSVTRSSSSRAPASVLKKMFGDGHAPGNLSLTQAFEGTQNISSPAVGLRSDPVFDRPSPNFRLEQSSPTAATSSPSNAHADVPQRAPSDPIIRYRSMEESQNERERRKQEEEAKMAQDDLDDIFAHSVPTALARQQRRQRTEMEMLKVFSDFQKPKRARSSAAAFSDERVATPLRQQAKADVAGDVNVHDKTPLLINDEESDVDASDMALTSAIQVPMTSSRGKSLSQLHPSASPSRRQTALNDDVRLPETDNALPADGDAGGTQKSYAVADSQGHINRHREVTPFSQDSDVRIAQSQYSTRVTKAIDVSSAPRPTAMLQVQEEQIPSSPPLKKVVSSEVEMQNQTNKAKAVAADEKGPVDLLNDHEMQVVQEGETDRPAPMMDGANVLGCDSILTTVPESDPVEPTRAEEQSHLYGRQRSNMDSKAGSNDSVSKGTNNSGTNATTVFETAQTHLSPVQNQKVISQVSNDTDESPVRRGRFRKLTEIAGESNSQHSSDSALDFNVLNGDDRMHLDVVAGKTSKVVNMQSSPHSSPVRPMKRRILKQPKPLSEPARNVNIGEPQETSSKRADLENSENVVEEDEAENVEAHDPSPLKDTEATRKSPHSKAGALNRPSRKQVTYGRDARRRQPRAQSSVYDVDDDAREDVRETVQPKANKQSKSHAAQVEEQTASATAATSKSMQKGPPVTTSTAATPDDDSEDVCVPSRVFAYFGGNTMAYFPATCSNKSHLNGLRLEVRFDDGTTVLLEPHQVRRLDLRVGDVVKIFRKQIKAKAFIVQGFKDKISDPLEEEFPLTDIRGYKTVFLAPKGRDSLPSNKLADESVMEVPLTDIYLTGHQWPNFADRQFNPADLHPNRSTRLLTPSNDPSMPTTPSTRSRRQNAKDAKTTQTREAVEVAPPKRTGLFANMVFAVSLGALHEAEKNQVTRAVLENGGQVLEGGFSTLFDDVSSSSGAATRAGGSPALRLRSWAADAGFAALLAAGHSRTAKFVQALALGLPCVHFRWALDSVAAGAAAPFDRYLLAAGEAAFLGRAVRSRVLVPYHPLSREARLPAVLARRPALLGGTRVLFVTGKGKAEERRRAFVFLTFALGAAAVVQVRDLQEAKVELGKAEFDMVYAEGNEDEVKRQLFVKSAERARKKGKKRRQGVEVQQDKGGVDEHGMPKLINDEFVVQSLILGALME